MLTHKFGSDFLTADGRRFTRMVGKDVATTDEHLYALILFSADGMDMNWL
jgi:hypothetical protein